VSSSSALVPGAAPGGAPFSSSEKRGALEGAGGGRRGRAGWPGPGGTPGAPRCTSRARLASQCQGGEKGTPGRPLAPLPLCNTPFCPCWGHTCPWRPTVAAGSRGCCCAPGREGPAERTHGGRSTDSVGFFSPVLREAQAGRPQQGHARLSQALQGAWDWMRGGWGGEGRGVARGGLT